jgi:myo-inositol catabolism protein IolS
MRSANKRITRRVFIAAGTAAALSVASVVALRFNRRPGGGNSIYPRAEMASRSLPRVNGMPMRMFGSTGMLVSEVGFGAWGIGGTGYGAVPRGDALNALSKAEELGCNFVDTSMTYGVSEEIIGDFMEARRQKWIIATKFSRQPAGLTATVERQLRRLRTDTIDFYQLHFYPRGREEALFEELVQLRESGKIRFAGVSLYTRSDITDALNNPVIDGFQVAFSLLEPDPFLARVRAIRERPKAIVIRSALRDGFLTGKYRRDAEFPDPADARHNLTRSEIELLVERVERFRFLEREAGSMVSAAAAYPLSFPEVSTVILGTKNESQAVTNFGQVPGKRLTAATLARISEVQFEIGVGSRVHRTLRKLGIA